MKIKLTNCKKIIYKSKLVQIVERVQIIYFILFYSISLIFFGIILLIIIFYFILFYFISLIFLERVLLGLC